MFTHGGVFSSPVYLYATPFAACLWKLGRFGRGGRWLRRGRSGRDGTLARASPVEDVRASCSRVGRGGSPRTPSLVSFVGVAAGSRLV